MSTLSREEYERACAELDLSPMTDDECFSPEIRERLHASPDQSFVETIFRRLAHARGWGIMHQLREKRKQLRWELGRRFARGMSRRQYEEFCTEASIQPAPDDAIRAMAADYLAREETEDLPDFNLFVANFRDQGIWRESGSNRPEQGAIVSR